MLKIKAFIESEKGKDILIILILILVGLGSFELGRLSREAPVGLKIEYPANFNEGALIITPPLETNVLKGLNTAAAAPVKTTSKQEVKPASTPAKNFFASSRGKKYYPVTCSAGKTIKLENRVYFTTALEAEKAGYTLSASCE
jgi:hypothetical protein